MTTTRPRVAVIGGGVSGLTAAHLLQRSHDVTLYESEARLGGHAHTHDVVAADGDLLAVDSGFIVYNERTYPNVVRLFDELGVETAPSDMSMSVRCDGCGLEYAGARGFGGLFAQAGRITSPTFWRMLVEVKRFHRRARALLAAARREAAEPGSGHTTGAVTLGDFMRSGGFSEYFEQHFMVPVVSCVWSCPPSTARLYPAAYLFEFLDHHGFLTIGGSPRWRTVVGGSRTYVERAAKGLTATAIGVPVRRIARTAAGVEVRDQDDDIARFDRVVIATHADQALALLDAPTDTERSVLGAFGYAVNPTVLHTDAAFLPRAPRARSSWNYLLDGCDGDGGVKVSYHMNRLQGIEGATDYLVTLNAGATVPDDAVLARMDYAHPVYTRESVRAQARLPEMNGDRVAYAGAYHGWGFHEDGCASGVRAAAHFGVTW